MEANFFEALSAWQTAAVLAAEKRHQCVLAQAEAMVTADGKNEAARKAQVTLATADAQHIAELAEIEAQAKLHVVLHLRNAKLDAAKTEEG